MANNHIYHSVKVKLQKMGQDVSDFTHDVFVDTKRKLTSGEVKMCQLVFKNSIDYSKVYLHAGGLTAGGIISKTGNAVTLDGETWFPIDEYKKNPDFSTSPLGQNRHWFIHEMTHIWQSQLGHSNGFAGAKILCTGGYTSTVNSVDSGIGELKGYDTDILGRDKNKKFSDFNFEQQGRLIEFWFDAMHLKNVNPSRQHHQKSLQLLPSIQIILSNFLKNPSDPTLLPSP